MRASRDSHVQALFFAPLRAPRGRTPARPTRQIATLSLRAGHFGSIRTVLYAIQASRKLDLPHPDDAPQRFDLLDPGPLPSRKAAPNEDPSTASADNRSTDSAHADR